MSTEERTVGAESGPPTARTTTPPGGITPAAHDTAPTAAAQAASAAATVVVDGVRKRYGRTWALDGVDLRLRPGVTGLLGPNGAGKTTLLRVLATVQAPDAGRVALLGLDPVRPAERVRVRRRLGYLPQEPGFHRSFTAFEAVDYVAILKELTDRRARHREVARALGAVGLTDWAGTRVRALSGGMRRRVALAQALLCDPELLVLDEPTVGLDPEQRLRFRDALSRFADGDASTAGAGDTGGGGIAAGGGSATGDGGGPSAGGRTVVLSTHQTEDVAALCARVAVIDRGRVVFDGTPRGLAETARGWVWVADARDPRAPVAWRTGDGTVRQLGDAPPGARLVEPTLEDGYLLLLGRVGAEVGTGSGASGTGSDATGTGVGGAVPAGNGSGAAR